MGEAPDYREQGPCNGDCLGACDIHQGDSHAKCMEAGEHVCHEPSGRVCVEAGCGEPAGTWWGPLWCPRHDKERLDRIGRNLAAIAVSLRTGTPSDIGNDRG